MLYFYFFCSKTMAYSWDNRVKFVVRYMYDIDGNGTLDKSDFECLAGKINPYWISCSQETYNQFWFLTLPIFFTIFVLLCPICFMACSLSNYKPIPPSSKHHGHFYLIFGHRFIYDFFIKELQVFPYVQNKTNITVYLTK